MKKELMEHIKRDKHTGRMGRQDQQSSNETEYYQLRHPNILFIRYLVILNFSFNLLLL